MLAHQEMAKHRLSVRKLAQHANVSATTIQSIRDGEARNISMGKLEHILKFVGRTIDFPPSRAWAKVACSPGKRLKISCVEGHRPSG
jgi:transcriptional regulator with XRE-family HTH domain